MRFFWPTLYCTQIVCYETRGPSCFDEDEVDILVYKYVLKQMNKAHKTEALGQEFIEGCQPLANRCFY